MADEVRRRKINDSSEKVPKTIVKQKDAGSEMLPEWLTWVAIPLVLFVLGLVLWKGQNEFVGFGTRKDYDAIYVVHNAKVLTMDPRVASSDVFVVENGHFVAVGKGKALLQKYRKAKMIDLGGKLVVPGLVDSHAHLLHLGHQLLQVDLRGCTSISQVREKLRQGKPQNGLLVGRNWNQELFTDIVPGTFPTANDLDQDEELAKLTIILYRVDVHAAWINNKALEQIEIKSVAGGEVVKENGKPTGIFIDKAMSLLKPIEPQYDDATQIKAMNLAIQQMLSFGLTGLHDAATSPKTIPLIKKMIQAGQFPIRYYAMMDCGTDYCGDNVEKEIGNHLTVHAVKLFADGAVGSWGSFMHEPYNDKNSTGLLLIQPDKLQELVNKYLENDWQIGVHAIGDKANTLVLDTYQKAIGEWNAKNSDILYFGGEKTIQGKKIKRGQDLRLRIEHAQFVSPQDQLRFAELGIIPSVQPTHCTSDMPIIESRLGNKRAQQVAYPWKSFIDHRVLALPLGSDFPVESANPLYGIYSAVTRKDHDGNSPLGKGKGWYTEQVLSKYQALKGFTLDAAFASFQEDKLGSISVGKRADFVVFDRNFMESKGEKDILRAKVVATVIDGEVWYGSLST